jgi:hypothetical protein
MLILALKASLTFAASSFLHLLTACKKDGGSPFCLNCLTLHRETCAATKE